MMRRFAGSTDSRPCHGKPVRADPIQGISGHHAAGTPFIALPMKIERISRQAAHSPHLKALHLHRPDGNLSTHF